MLCYFILDLYSLSGKMSYRQISWSLEAAILGINGRIVLKFCKYFGISATEAPVKFQSDWKSINPNHAATKPHEILR